MLRNQIVTIFGGSGFVGRQIVRELARAGYTVRVATRNPQSCYALRPEGVVGQVVPVYYDPGRPDMIGSVVSGSYAVVNCVGILYERGKSKFHAAHVELVRQIATACKRYGVQRFVHLSALGVDRAKSNYARSKLSGEQIVRDIFPAVTVLRPSVIFGPEDGFFNMFARLASLMPVLPLIGGGVTRFQPVYVGDVADAVMVAIDDTAEIDSRGKTYELGGPDVVTFKDIYGRLFDYTGSRCLISMPWGMAKAQAWFMQKLPAPLLTVDQVKSLQSDSVVAEGASGFQALQIEPTSMDVILPTYLETYRKGGKFAERKRA